MWPTAVFSECAPEPTEPLAWNQKFGAVTLMTALLPFTMSPESVFRYTVSVPAPEVATVERTRSPEVSIRRVSPPDELELTRPFELMSKSLPSWPI